MSTRRCKSSRNTRTCATTTRRSKCGRFVYLFRFIVYNVWSIFSIYVCVAFRCTVLASPVRSMFLRVRAGDGDAVRGEWPTRRCVATPLEQSQLIKQHSKDVVALTYDDEFRVSFSFSSLQYCMRQAQYSVLFAHVAHRSANRLSS